MSSSQPTTSAAPGTGTAIPGARCDIPTTDYTYSFDPELERDWTWSEKYATQPEILRYLQFVADRYDLRRDIEFSTRVAAAAWDDAASLWRVRTDRGRRAFVPVLRDGDRLPVDAEGGRHRGRRSVRRATCTSPAAGRTRASTSPGSGSPSSALARRGPVHPAHRRAGRGADRVPAHAGLLGPRAQRSPSAGSLAATRRRPRRLPAMRRSSRAGASLRSRSSSPRRCVPRRSAALVSRPHRRRASSSPSSASSPTRRVNPESNEIVAEMIREKIRSIVTDPETAESLCREGLLLRHQAAVSRHRLLRDLQPAARPSGRPAQGPDQDHHRDRHRDGRRLIRVRRHRLRHRIRRDDRARWSQSTSPAVMVSR